MPAQLGNALTQMMQLKQMRAQNKLAEFQMQQAKAAQVQATRAAEYQRQAMAEIMEDPNSAIAKLAGDNFQGALSIYKLKKEGQTEQLDRIIKYLGPLHEAFQRGDTATIGQALGPQALLPQNYQGVSNQVETIYNAADEANYKSQTLYKDGKKVEAKTKAQFNDYKNQGWSIEEPESAETLTAEERAYKAYTKQPGKGNTGQVEFHKIWTDAGRTPSEKGIITPADAYKRISTIRQALVTASKGSPAELMMALSQIDIKSVSPGSDLPKTISDILQSGGPDPALMEQFKRDAQKEIDFLLPITGQKPEAKATTGNGEQMLLFRPTLGQGGYNLGSPVEEQ